MAEEQEVTTGEETPAEEHQFTEEEQTLLDSQAAEEEAEQQAQVEADEEEEKSVEKKPWFQKRIDKLAKQKGEESRRADRLEKIIENMSTQPRAEPAAQEIVTEKPVSIDRPRPTLEGCEFDQERYTDELTDWKLDTREAQRTQDAAKTTRESDQRSAQQQFTEGVTEANRKGNEKYPDYQERLDALPGDVLHVGLAYALLETKEPADVAYYLATNPEEAARIAKLPQAKMLAEVIRLEAKAIVPVPEKKKTNAPPPVKPVGGNETAGAEPDAKKDPKAWIKWERERCKKVGRRY